MTGGVYASPAYSQKLCWCGAHRQHRILRFVWANPSAPQAVIARELGISQGNVKEGLFRLRRRNLSVICPECFEPKLFGGVCQNCGFEPDLPVFPLDVMAKSQSPTNHIHAGNLLGSELNYKAVGFTSNGEVVKRWMERSLEEPLVKAVKSDVENELKRFFPSEQVTDEAGRLVLKEIVELRAHWPALVSSKNARKQATENVMNRLRLLHPQLRMVSRLEGDGHEF